MAAPSVTYSFTNGTTSDASQVNTNFTDLINALTDGSADITIGSISVAGAAAFSGTVTLGNASSDDITWSGQLASNIAIKTNTTYGIGSSTSGLSGIYLGGSSTKTTRIVAGTVGTSWTFTLPNDVPTITGQTLVFNTSGTAEFRYPDKFTATKTANYTATGDETVILCDPTTGTASFTVTLPAASTCTGKELTIVKVDSGLTYTVTIDANSSETILPSVQSSNLTYILYTQYESVTLKCNGTSWYAVHHLADTDWIDAGTLTIEGTTSNPTKGNTQTTDKVRWRRVGSNAHIRMYFRQTSGVGGAAGSGDYLFKLPTGMSIDTAKVEAYTTAEGWNSSWVQVFCLGTAEAYDGTTNAQGAVSIYDSTRVRMFIQAAGALQGGAPGSVGFNLTNTNCGFGLDFIVPISGWNP